MRLLLPLILVLLLHAASCQNSTVVGKWEVSQKLGNRVTDFYFSKVFMPVRNIISLYPVLASQPIYIPKYDQEFEDICVSMKQRIPISNFDCESYYCDNFAQNPLFSNKPRQIANLINYCWYCASAYQSIDRHVQFRNIILQGKQNVYNNQTDRSARCYVAFTYVSVANRPANADFMLEQCGNSVDASADDFGFPYAELQLTPPSVSDFKDVYTKDIKAVACYCMQWDRYGYKCDFITRRYLYFMYFILPFVYLAFDVIMAIVVAVFLFYPTVVKQLRLIQLKWKRKTSFCEWLGFAIRCMFEVYIQISILLLASAVILSLEQIFGFLKHLDRVDLEYASGSLRMVSIYLLWMSFYAMLISWSNISYRASKLDANTSLTIGHKIFLVLGYLLTILSTAVLFATYFTTYRLSYMYAAFTALMGILSLIFPPGYLAHGIRLFCVLKKANKQISFIGLKFTKFMIATTVLFIAQCFVMIMLTLQYVVAWDIYSIYIGGMRQLLMDGIVHFHMLLMFAVLLNEKDIKRALCCVEQTQQDFQYASIATNESDDEDDTLTNDDAVSSLDRAPRRKRINTYTEDDSIYEELEEQYQQELKRQSDTLHTTEEEQPKSSSGPFSIFQSSSSEDPKETPLLDAAQ